MSSVAELDTGHVLDELVQQFADPFAFFRELIQNAIDAGSLEVDVAFEWEPADSGGRLTIFIEDWGEGMNREIIEGKLTRLFSSGKDDDFTKIGKFGIGFVSVFAIRPDAVCVDTGRGGENWRVLFGPDRDWQLIELDYPVEGTQIRVFKTLEDEKAMTEFVARSRNVIRQWCRHVEVPVRIEGEDVREPFVVPNALVTTKYEEEGTRISAAIVNQAAGPYGFYNRGLLLQEGPASPFPFIGFKIDSRYLEHTLTRDQVVRDKHYQKAMKLIEKVVREDLPEAVMRGMEEEAQQGSSDRYRTHIQATIYGSVRLDEDRPIVPVLGGGAVSLKEARRASKKGGVFLSRELDELAKELSGRDHTFVLDGRPDGTLADLLTRWGIEARGHGESYSMVREIETAEVPGGTALVGEVERLVRALGGKPTWVGMGTAGPTQALHSPMLALEDRREVLAHGTVPPPGVAALISARHIVIQPTHDVTKEALKMARHEPEFAAYQLLKAAVLVTGLEPVSDTMMATAAVEARESRRTGGAR